MSKTTKIKTNNRAISAAIGKHMGAHESAGNAAAKVDETAKDLGATLDNQGLAMLVTINAKPDAKYENWAKTWASVFGMDDATTRQTYDLCRKHLGEMRKGHAELLKAGTTTEAFNTMLQRVRKHMFLAKPDKNKGKEAKKRAADKGNKSLFQKVQKSRKANQNGGGNRTPSVTANTFDAKHAAIVKKIEELQKAFAPVNAFVTDAHNDRAITKASSKVVKALSDILTNLETIKGDK